MKGDLERENAEGETSYGDALLKRDEEHQHHIETLLQELTDLDKKNHELYEYKKKKVKIKPGDGECSSLPRSASLPIVPPRGEITPRRSQTMDRLTPPMYSPSPKSESVMGPTFDFALPNTGTSPGSAKQALLSVLSQSGADLDLEEDLGPVKHSKSIDPLMQLEIPPSEDCRDPLVTKISCPTMGTVPVKSKHSTRGSICRYTEGESVLLTREEGKNVLCAIERLR